MIIFILITDSTEHHSRPLFCFRNWQNCLRLAINGRQRDKLTGLNINFSPRHKVPGFVFCTENSRTFQGHYRTQFQFSQDSIYNKNSLRISETRCSGFRGTFFSSSIYGQKRGTKIVYVNELNTGMCFTLLAKQSNNKSQGFFQEPKVLFTTFKALHFDVQIQVPPRCV